MLHHQCSLPFTTKCVIKKIVTLRFRRCWRWKSLSQSSVSIMRRIIVSSSMLGWYTSVPMFFMSHCSPSKYLPALARTTCIVNHAFPSVNRSAEPRHDIVIRVYFGPPPPSTGVGVIEFMVLHATPGAVHQPRRVTLFELTFFRPNGRT